MFCFCLRLGLMLSAPFAFAVGFMDCTQLVIVVCCLCGWLGLAGFCRSGSAILQMEIAPRSGKNFEVERNVLLAQSGYNAKVVRKERELESCRWCNYSHDPVVCVGVCVCWCVCVLVCVCVCVCACEFVFCLAFGASPQLLIPGADTRGSCRASPTPSGSFPAPSGPPSSPP